MVKQLPQRSEFLRKHEISFGNLYRIFEMLNDLINDARGSLVVIKSCDSGKIIVLSQARRDSRLDQRCLSEAGLPVEQGKRFSNAQRIQLVRLDSTPMKIVGRIFGEGVK